MKNLKAPSDFKSYQKWQDAPSKVSYRQKIHRVEKTLQDAQSKYSTLEKAISKQYQNSNSDLDKIEDMESKFENCKAEIKELMQERKDLQKEAEQAENKKHELRQAFIEEVAESGDYVALIEHFSELIDQVNNVNNILKKWNAIEPKNDLRALPPAEILYWVNELQDDRIQAMKDRMQELKSGTYKIREVA